MLSTSWRKNFFHEQSGLKVLGVKVLLASLMLLLGHAWATIAIHRQEAEVRQSGMHCLPVFCSHGPRCSTRTEHIMALSNGAQTGGTLFLDTLSKGKQFAE